MATYIKTMKDINGDTVLPRTSDKAVTVGDGSSNLETALSNRPEKPSLLPEMTTLLDTDLVTIQSGTDINKMTVGNLKDTLGIKSGGIVESGIIDNSTYLKFEDGALICQKQVNMYYATPDYCDYTWTFPVPTISTAYYVGVMLFGMYSGGSNWKNVGVTRIDARSTTSVNIKQYAIGTFASNELFTARLLLIGKWK